MYNTKKGGEKMYDSSLLGENIRKYRRVAGLTQSELAERLYLTAQNISKWETGKSYPDLVNLCSLARELGVSVDALLSSVGTDTLPLIAIDGGGTKTEFCLFEKDGRVIERVVLGGTNPNAYGIETALSTLFAGIDRLRLVSSHIGAIYAGIAGCGLKENKQHILKELSKRYSDTVCMVDGDVPSIIYSTERYNDCIAVIMGTGSVVCASKDGGVERFGGYGYLFDEGYSGYTLGRGALIAALCDEDGVGEKTAMTAMIREILGGTVHEKLNTLYTSDKDRIATFSRVVFDAYDKNDSVARKIIRDALNITLSQIRAAQNKHNTSGHLVLAGGLTARRDILEENIGKCEFELFYPTLPPIYGAAVCASRALGELEEGFYTKFKESYVNIKKEGKA